MTSVSKNNYLLHPFALAALVLGYPASQELSAANATADTQLSPKMSFVDMRQECIEARVAGKPDPAVADISDKSVGRPGILLLVPEDLSDQDYTNIAIAFTSGANDFSINKGFESAVVIGVIGKNKKGFSAEYWAFEQMVSKYESADVKPSDEALAQMRSDTRHKLEQMQAHYSSTPSADIDNKKHDALA